MGASVTKAEYKDIKFHEKLGEGAFGIVNRVTFKRSFKGHKEAAAKTVLHDIAENEVKIMAELQHPNIVTMLGICQTGHVNIILLEYAKYGSLHDYLADKSKPLSVGLKKKWMRESAMALQYLHSLNYLHRDLKASNCLIFEDTVLKLCDFGLAREIDHSQSTSSQKGTYRYMAPELHRLNEHGRAVYSKPADVYAYGMLVLEIQTRKLPFEGMEWHAVVFHVGNGKQPDLPNDCPRDLVDLMRRCWSTNPMDRPSIDNIFVEYLREWQLIKTIISEHQGRSLRARRITCFPSGDSGDIVVAHDHPSIFNSNKLYILNSDGEKKAMIDAERVGDVAISRRGQVVLVVESNTVKVFDSDLNYLHRFSALKPNGKHNKNAELKCVALDKEGQIVVYDMKSDMITIHTCPEGKLVSSFKIKSSKHSNEHASMVVNNKNQILLHFLPRRSMYTRVVAVDYSGSEIFTFTPEIEEDMTGQNVWPGGIICDAGDNIYIAVKVSKVDCTGHIHRYNSTGTFLECIARRLLKPCDLAITFDGSLVVANWKSILTYSLT